MKPLVGGATDGVIDEIVGLPMACKTVVELATDKEIRQAFGKLFTSEGFTTMSQGIKQEAKEVANDKDKQFYYGAVAAVSVVAMLFGQGS